LADVLFKIKGDAMQAFNVKVNIEMHRFSGVGYCL